MADTGRAQRNLREDITHANRMLAHWRQDGHYGHIMHWLARRDELLDRLAKATAHLPTESPQPQ